MELVELLFQSGIPACIDSLFYSAQYSEAFLENGFRLTGVAKNSNREFPIAYISGQKVPTIVITTTKNENGTSTTVIWAD